MVLVPGDGLTGKIAQAPHIRRSSMQRATQIITHATLLSVHACHEELKAGRGRLSRTLPKLPLREVMLTRLCYFAFRSRREDPNRARDDGGRNTTAAPTRVTTHSRLNQPVNRPWLNDATILSRTNITRLRDELVSTEGMRNTVCAPGARKPTVALTDKGAERARQAPSAQLPCSRGADAGYGLPAVAQSIWPVASHPPCARAPRRRRCFTFCRCRLEIAARAGLGPSARKSPGR